MTIEEIRELERIQRSKHKYYDDLTAPFSDYIKSPDGKYVITITKSQYVFNAELGGDHAFMAADLIKLIRPDIKTDDWGNAYNRDEDFRDHNPFVLGYTNYSLVSIPRSEKLSIEQYEKLEEILLDIKENNERKSKNGRPIWELFMEVPDGIGIKSGFHENEIDLVLEALKGYTTLDYDKPEEVIIGAPISKVKEL